MAFIFKDYRPRIADKMAKGDVELKKWLFGATFAKTSNGYWLAWQGEKPDTVLVLPPADSPDIECHWLESWDKDDTIETAIEYVESVRFAEDEPDGINITILKVIDKKTGQRLYELEDDVRQDRHDT